MISKFTVILSTNANTNLSKYIKINQPDTTFYMLMHSRILKPAHCIGNIGS